MRKDVMGIRESGYLAIRFFLLLFFFSLFTIHVSLASEIPRFYADEVVVTAAKIPQPLSRSPWNVVVISADKAKSIGAENVADALRIVPGVDIYSAGGKGGLKSVRIKGANAEEVLVLIDGCRINSPLLGMVDLGDILLERVERIEVITSPLSSMYGSDAVGGVINVITKKRADKTTQNLSLNYGSFADRKLTYSFGKENFLFSAVADKSDGFRQNSDYWGQNYSISQAFKNDLGDLSLGINYYAADKGVPGVPNSAADPYSASTPDNRQQDKNINLALDYEKSLGNSDFSAKIYQNTTDQQYHEYNFWTASFTDYTYWTAQNGINLLNNLHLVGGGVLGLGLEYREDIGHSSAIGNHSINELALFANQEVEQGPLAISAGVRVDQHSTAGQSISPRVAISLKPVEDIKLWGNLATGMKAPTLNELYWNDPIYMMYGDPNLLPEKSVGVQLGANKYFGAESFLGFSLFARQITDQILWEFDPATFICQARNIGRAEVTGWDAQFSSNLFEGISCFANATYQLAIDKEDVTAANVGKDVPYSPRLKSNIGVEWQNRLGKLVILGKQVGERYADAGNTIQLDPYTVVDLTYTKDNGPIQITAKVNNLFNGSYAEAVGWHPVTYAILEYPMPGRSITVGLNWNI